MKVNPNVKSKDRSPAAVTGEFSKTMKLCPLLSKKVPVLCMGKYCAWNLHEGGNEKESRCAVRIIARNIAAQESREEKGSAT